VKNKVLQVASQCYPFFIVILVEEPVRDGVTSFLGGLVEKVLGGSLEVVLGESFRGV
jgi:hypothetical protein